MSYQGLAHHALSISSKTTKLMNLSFRTANCQKRTFTQNVFISTNLNAKTSIAPQITPRVCHIPIPSVCPSVISRDFSDARRSKKNDGPLINEHLIRSLMGRNKNNSADDIRIRLLIDQGRGIKPDVQVLSLKEAISISSEREVDLVSINLKQDVPVVKAVDYQKFIYDQRKKSAGGSKPNSNKKATKEYSFKAGIQENDIERKAKGMISYLTKGHPCQVVITARRRYLNADKDAVITTLERVQALVADHGEAVGKMKKNEYGNRASMMFQPKSRSR